MNASREGAGQISIKLQQISLSNELETRDDRISNLPDSLLHHILDFLDIQHGARSAVLSKRWNQIWTTVPVLDFLFPNDVSSCPTSSQTRKFIDFVDGTLRRHNSSNLDKFYLGWMGDWNESLLHSWISNLIKGNIKVLTLYLNESMLQPPPSLFTCETLTSLELGTLVDLRARSDFHFPKDIYFPRLERLKLSGIKLSDSCWNEQLFSNSPVLKELILEVCIFSMDNFCISIPTLKRLEIIVIDGCLEHCALKIETPSLVTFTYDADPAKEYLLSSFPALEEAVIRLHSKTNGAEISGFLRSLAYVKCLTVNDLTLQAISSGLSNNLLTFHNVKMLEISGGTTNDQRLIALLKAVPNLESLVIWVSQILYTLDEVVEDSDTDDGDNTDEDDENSSDEDSDVSGSDGEDANHGHENVVVSDAVVCDNNDAVEANCDIEDDNWVLSILTNGCLFPHLKLVNFRYSVRSPKMMMRWVKLILRDANALQMMTFPYNFDGEATARSGKELVAEISRFPRASAECVFKCK